MAMLTTRNWIKFTTTFQVFRVHLFGFRKMASLMVKGQESGQENAKMLNWKCRVDLTAALRGLEMMNLEEGICNHLSLMAPAASGQGKVMLMLPYGYHWREVEPEHLVGFNAEGEIVEGKGEIEISALTIHQGIHKTRPDAIAAFHLHPPYATALGMLRDLPFGMYHQNSCYFYDDFAFDREYSGLSLDTNEGERIAKHMGNKKVLFMCNHGVMITGPSVAEVFNDTYYLERACYFQGLAMSMGRELFEIPDDVSKMAKEQYDLNRKEMSYFFFETIKRIVYKKNIPVKQIHLHK